MLKASFQAHDAVAAPGKASSFEQVNALLKPPLLVGESNVRRPGFRHC
jgi:hypothetical protein